MTFTYALPLLLSFIIGALVGILAAGMWPVGSPASERALVKERSDSLLWLLLLAAFTFGVLIAFALSLLS